MEEVEAKEFNCGGEDDVNGDLQCFLDTVKTLKTPSLRIGEMRKN